MECKSPRNLTSNGYVVLLSCEHCRGVFGMLGMGLGMGPEMPSYWISPVMNVKRQTESVESEAEVRELEAASGFPGEGRVPRQVPRHSEGHTLHVS